LVINFFFLPIHEHFLFLFWNTLSGPTPVMLSSPYSKNIQFASGQPLDSNIMSSSSAPSQGSAAASLTQGSSTKRGSAHRANSSPYRQPPSRVARKQQQQRSESDDTDQSQTPAKPRTGRSKKPPHELLTEAEKKANHIASEQKRRQNIRVGFDQLVEIVPTLSQSHRSEAIILQKCKSSFCCDYGCMPANLSDPTDNHLITLFSILPSAVDHIHRLVATKNDLKDRVRELQSVLGEL
jgi:Helix-loop-helix DNA-binding domain